MSDSYHYFTVPITNVPDSSPYTVWFATWSSDQRSFVWSTQRPAAGTCATPTYVCVRSATKYAAPAGATIIIENTSKTLPPPPVIVSSTASETEFSAALKQQLINQLDRLRSL